MYAHGQVSWLAVCVVNQNDAIQPAPHTSSHPDISGSDVLHHRLLYETQLTVAGTAPDSEPGVAHTGFPFNRFRIDRNIEPVAHLRFGVETTRPALKSQNVILYGHFLVAERILKAYSQLPDSGLH